MIHMGGVESSRDVYIKKLEEIISRIERIINTVKEADVPGKSRLLEDLEDLVSSAEDAIDRIASGKSWSEEVKEVVTAASPMVEKALSSIGEMMSQVVNKYMEIMDGRKIGENIAALYRSLKEAGMPENMIEKIVENYVTQITTTVPAAALPNIMDFLQELLGGRKHKEVETTKKEVDKERQN